ncbi:unnamed protein product [Notodromas monacha]|uniref:C2H2-type domain-containing protein n=1 Tax=Notodromas monacha TaxID=399045 RepID=A0A7R9BK10_9CRUS|nr:unnamed protein product [Notodromas monacha]CAG0916900.1 unnamed protein product [Notodromas monacha]
MDERCLGAMDVDSWELLDAKKSPLALLAQTCSQIGAENGSLGVKTSGEKRGRADDDDASYGKLGNKSPSLCVSDHTKHKLSKSDDGLKHKSLSEVPVSNNSSSSSPAQTVHPIIRSGVEVLQGQMAAAAASHGFGSYPFAQSQMYAQSQAQGYPSLGYDPAALLRSAPFYYPHLFGGGAAAAAAVNNHAAALANAYRPYMTVHHQLSNCRDPFCVGQCQQTVPSPVMPSTFTEPGPTVVTLVDKPPYVCNWIAGGEAYCGKRFSTSEELLAHLRTHTSSSSSASVMAAAQSSPVLSQQPQPVTTRYHPYKPAHFMPPPPAPVAPPVSAAAAAAAAAAAYYSPYSALYAAAAASRIGL